VIGFQRDNSTFYVRASKLRMLKRELCKAEGREEREEEGVKTGEERLGMG
jgi:hypothetical protein